MKKNILIILCVLVITLCGCVPYGFYGEPFETDFSEPTYDATQTRIPIPTFPLRTAAPATTAPAKSTWTPIPTKAPIPTKTPVGNTKIASKLQLMNFLTQNIDNENYRFTFEYTGGEKLDFAEICRMSKGICSVNITENNNVYNVRLNPYPSKRILEAYYSGNTSKLNNAELAAYNKAVSILKEAKSKTSDMVDLELYLHDVLIDLVEYDDTTREIIDANDPPHNLTVVGALVDRRANCQGYADAFYTLATMAGFEVSYMSVYTKDDLHQVNTIKLNGQWYVVDVTFDDLDGVAYNKSAKSYYLFNVGKDLIFDFNWYPHCEVNPIASKTSNYFYYNYYGKKYNNIDAFTTAAANAWKSGAKEVYGMVPSGGDPKALESSLNNSFKKVTNQSVSYTYWYTTDGTVYYYQVLFG